MALFWSTNHIGIQAIGDAPLRLKLERLSPAF